VVVQQFAAWVRNLETQACAEGKGRPWTVARRRGPGYLLMCSMCFVALRRTAWHEGETKLWQKL